MSNNYNCRRKYDLYVKSVSSHYGEKSSLFKGCSLWNKLPESIKAIKDVSSFKHSVKLFLQNGIIHCT